LIIQNKILEEVNYLNKITSKDYPIYQFPIKCSKMPSFEEFDFWTRKDTYFSELFLKLDTLTNPCIYWFELENEEFSNEVKATTNLYRSKRNLHNRTIPAKNKNALSKYLYVGIRQGGFRKKDGLSNIAGRIFQHLGYYHIGSTQGLQLVHWSKYDLILNIIELPKEAESYLTILEKLIAMNFKPLLGKH